MRQLGLTVRLAAAAQPLFILAFALMLASNFVHFQFLGFNFTGLSWFAILAWSIITAAIHAQRAPAFPLWIWAPWALYVLGSGFQGHAYGWQSTAQVLCPLGAGIAASMCRLNRRSLASIEALVRVSYGIFFAAFLLVVVPFAFRDIENSGFPTLAVSALVFQSYFLASFFVSGRRKADLLLYLSALAIPLVSANRGPLLASIGLLVLAAVPISLARRVVIVALAAMLGAGAFYTPKMQHKMFYSGNGGLEDLRLDNPDLNMSGRAPMWEALVEGIRESPWFGHGANADRTRLLDLGFATYLPHNDWLRVLFNYGTLGAFLLIAAMTAQVFHLSHLPVRGQPELRALGAAAASCFGAFAFLMATDNVLIYCQFFTVPMMLLVGATYSMCPERSLALIAHFHPGARCEVAS